MAILTKATVTLSILVAVVIFLLAFAHNNRDAIEKPQILRRAPLGSFGQTTVTNQIKDFAIDKKSSGPTNWILHGKHEYEGAPTLSQEVIDNIQKFAFFIGYPRSGHSILGSLMDAHPHMVISNEFLLFKNWKYFSDRQKEVGEKNPFYKHKHYLFNILYRRSYWDTIEGLRTQQSTNKNYTLSMDTLWQGKFNKYVSIIGDKSGGSVASCYLASNSTFARYLEELRETVTIPMKAIHVIRNPFDQISTCALYKDHKLLSDYTEMALQESVRNLKHQPKTITVSKFKSAMNALQVKGDNKTFAAARYDGEKRLKYCILKLAKRASAVSKMIKLIGPSNVIEIHGADLVNDPKSTMGKLCSELEIECSAEYLQACADKVFKSTSRTRDMLVWSPEMKEQVMEEIMHTYSFFSKYSFETE